ncbi:Cilia- and flagella-associated protein 20, partial [Fragariocoptes setiger]
MFRNTFQSGFLSILYSIGSQPLQLYDTKVRNGSIKRITDDEIKSLVIEITSSNVSTTFITCPKTGLERNLGIKLPIFVMIMKGLNRYFTFEIEILDDTKTKRRFRASNFQSETKVRDNICTMPLRLEHGWNQITLNLPDYCRRAYCTNYVETVRLTVNANCKLRRIYFCDKVYPEEELPAEFKLCLPVT